MRHIRQTYKADIYGRHIRHLERRTRHAARLDHSLCPCLYRHARARCLPPRTRTRTNTHTHTHMSSPMREQHCCPGLLRCRRAYYCPRRSIALASSEWCTTALAHARAPTRSLTRPAIARSLGEGAFPAADETLSRRTSQSLMHAHMHTRRIMHMLYTT